MSNEGLWHRTLVYLGLKEESEEGHDDLPERSSPEEDPHAEHASARPGGSGARGGGSSARAGGYPSRTEGTSARAGDDEGEEAPVRALRNGDAHVRAVPSMSVARAAIVELDGFDAVEGVGARYRTGQAVLFDLAHAPASDARRVVDFVSGLTYASRGQLTKVGNRAFLLVPDGVNLPTDERRRLGDLGYRLPSRSGG